RRPFPPARLKVLRRIAEADQERFGDRPSVGRRDDGPRFDSGRSRSAPRRTVPPLPDGGVRRLLAYAGRLSLGSDAVPPLAPRRRARAPIRSRRPGAARLRPIPYGRGARAE